MQADLQRSPSLSPSPSITNLFLSTVFGLQSIAFPLDSSSQKEFEAKARGRFSSFLKLF